MKGSTEKQISSSWWRGFVTACQPSGGASSLLQVCVCMCVHELNTSGCGCFCQAFIKFEQQREPHWALHTVGEKGREKRLNSLIRAHTRSEFSSHADRSKKRLLFTLRLSKHCGLPSGKCGGWGGGLLYISFWKAKVWWRQKWIFAAGEAEDRVIGPDVAWTQLFRSESLLAGSWELSSGFTLSLMLVRMILLIQV